VYKCPACTAAFVVGNAENGRRRSSTGHAQNVPRQNSVQPVRPPACRRVARRKKMVVAGVVLPNSVQVSTSRRVHRANVLPPNPVSRKTRWQSASAPVQALHNRRRATAPARIRSHASPYAVHPACERMSIERSAAKAVKHKQDEIHDKRYRPRYAAVRRPEVCAGVPRNRSGMRFVSKAGRGSAL